MHLPGVKLVRKERSLAASRMALIATGSLAAFCDLLSAASMAEWLIILSASL
jgi:hypothetical protein